MADDFGRVPSGQALVSDQASVPCPDPTGFDPSREVVIAMARVIALHGLGTINGKNRCGPPNEKWTVDEWQERILCCIPSEAEYRCMALAEELYELATQSTGDPQ